MRQKRLATRRPEVKAEAFSSPLTTRSGSTGASTPSVAGTATAVGAFVARGLARIADSRTRLQIPGEVTDSGAPLLAGRYRLESVLGRGSMGTVWAATDEVLRRPVAVKQVTVPPGLPTGEAVQLREARAVAAQSSPYVVTVFDVLTPDAGPVIVMELFRGRSLAIRDVGRLTDGQAATVGVAVASALRAAHAAGITHRDVKPANVLIGVDGGIKLTDFGVARSSAEPTMTGTGMILGSAAYLAPEVAEGRLPRLTPAGRVDHRTASSPPKYGTPGGLISELPGASQPRSGHSWY